MSDEKTATFKIALKDGLSKESADAARALEDLKKKLKDDTAALSAMEVALRRMKGATDKDTVGIALLNDAIKKQKNGIASVQGKIIGLGGLMEKTGEKAEYMAGSLYGVGSAIAESAIAAGAVGIAAAMITLTAATLGVTVALLKYGIAQSEARRNELLRFGAMRTVFGRSMQGARDLQEAIDSTSDRTAAGREQITGYASSLYRAGFRGEELQRRLDRLTIRGLGGSAVAEARLDSLDVIAEKLHENVGRIFDGLDVASFARQLRSVTEVFSQATVEGKALKMIFESVFQPFLTAIGETAPFFRAFIDGAIIATLKLAIQFQRLRRWYYQTFGPVSVHEAEHLTGALEAGKVVVYGLALGLGVAAAAVAFLGLAAVGLAAVLAAPFIAAYLAAESAYNQFNEFIDTVKALFTDTDWASLGTSLVQGLIDGVYSMFPNFTGAIEQLAASATGTIQNALGIHSPSRVFAEFGRQIPAGLAMGMEEGVPNVERAAEDMAPAPQGGGIGGSSSSSLTIESITIHTQATDAQGVAESLRSKLAEVLEGMISISGAEPA